MILVGLELSVVITTLLGQPLDALYVNVGVGTDVVAVVPLLPVVVVPPALPQAARSSTSTKAEKANITSDFR
jgi:hypothetical protein